MLSKRKHFLLLTIQNRKSYLKLSYFNSKSLPNFTNTMIKRKKEKIIKHFKRGIKDERFVCAIWPYLLLVIYFNREVIAIGIVFKRYEKGKKMFIYCFKE